MKFTAEKSDLRKALLIAKKRKPSKQSGVQRNVAINAIQTEDDGADLVVLVSGRKKHRIATKVPAKVHTSGDIYGQISDFDQKVRNCQNQSAVIVSNIGSPPNEMDIKAHSRPMVRNIEDDPKSDHIVEQDNKGDPPFSHEGHYEDFEHVVTVDSDRRIEEIQKAMDAGYRMCQSTNRVKDRPNLRSVHYEGLGDDGGFSATDGAGAVHINTILKTPNEIDIPYNTAEVISYAIKKEDPDEVEFRMNDADEYLVRIGDTDVFFEQVKETFPSISEVMPDHNDHRDTFKVSDLINILKELRNEDLVSVTASDDGIQFQAPGDQPENCDTEMQLDAKPLYKKVKGAYKHVSGEVSVSMGGNLEPLRFCHDDNGWDFQVNVVVMGMNPNEYESPVNNES